MPPTKVCSHCQIRKPITSFPSHPKGYWGGRVSWCKACRNAYDRAKRQSVLADLLAKQDSKCAICQTPLTVATANRDHCHQTGVTRGALCFRCNVVLGQVHDDITVLRAMADYLAHVGA